MINLSSKKLVYKNNEQTEFLVSQLSNTTEKILCVKDGFLLLIYESLNDIPTNLFNEHVKYNLETDTTEYYWRSKTDDSLYAIFRNDVHKELKRREDDLLTGNIVKF